MLINAILPKRGFITKVGDWVYPPANTAAVNTEKIKQAKSGPCPTWGDYEWGASKVTEVQRDEGS